MKRISLSNPLAFVWNIALVYLVYIACRLAYLYENLSAFPQGLSLFTVNQAWKGCFLFDTSAILYTNALYALFMLLPLHYKETNLGHRIAKFLFWIPNSLCVVMNLADAVYFQYTGRRTTASVFQEFSHESNLGTVFTTEIFHHWYLVLLGVLLMTLLWKGFLKSSTRLPLSSKVRYYAVQACALALFVPLCIGGIRGGFTKAVRPITLSNANQYVNRPLECAVVLNTPFSFIRSVGKTAFKDPKYFSREHMAALYSPIHQPVDSVAKHKKNVVVLIVESFGREYIGAYNDYPGYTPFTDSLLTQSLTFQYTFSNGRKSIDGMPSILSGIPRFNEPFFVTPAAMNEVSGLAGELQHWGYQTAFFHGAENGSMGFEAFARKTGYQQYLGRTEYDADPRFQGEKDFDGTWAIWDGPFLQFYAQKMTEMKEPFCTTVFTASSHHPYHVPQAYQDRFPDEPGDANPLHKCIRYVDFCLQQFFETAKQQPWYQNTLFVLTADHTNLITEPAYQTDLGLYSVPILFFDPSGEMETGVKEGIAQQIDIMPTVLRYLGYDQPFLAFGKDLLHTAPQDTWAVSQENNVYQYVKGSYLLQMTEDGTVKGLYDLQADWFLQHNLKDQETQVVESLKPTLQALIQDYMIRMTEDQLTVK